MPYLSIDRSDELMVTSRMKRQTLRFKGKREIKPGDILKMGVRNRETREVRMIMLAHCTEVIKVEMWLEKGMRPRILLNGVDATPEERVALANSEGFAGTAEMIRHFKAKHLPYGRTSSAHWRGVLIRW